MYRTRERASLKIVIWGLVKTRHSHRFIHGNFATVFKRMGYTVYWVEDDERNTHVVDKNSIVIASNLANAFLPIVTGAKYVLHNFSALDLALKENNYLHLQVRTLESAGKAIDKSIALYDEKSRTLFQPWGTPVHPYNWIHDIGKRSTIEFWIGSIWNNPSDQGNVLEIERFRSALHQRGSKLVRLGGTRFPSKSGLPESIVITIANKSRYSATIVGNWQKENQYIPCRLFRNIVAGRIPSSNADFSMIFPNGMYSSDLDELLSKLDSMTIGQELAILRESQSRLLDYTYENAIKRLMICLDDS